MSSENFEQYRHTTGVFTVGRLIIGLVLIGICWGVTTLLAMIPGIYQFGPDVEALLTSRSGTMLTLLSFSGMWIGVWLVQKFLHRESISHVLGWSRRVNWTDVGKGFAAVAITSVISELLIYALRPTMSFAADSVGKWLLYALPIIPLCFLQTSAEELVFRGYFTRSLASMVRTPLVWAVIPAVCFVCMHLSPSMPAAQIVLTILTIGSLTAALVYFVYRTGNLGAGFGLHFGNNLFAFLLVSHQAELGGFALLRGASIEELASWGDTAAICLISIACVALTVVLLTHRQSPLRVSG